MSNKKNTAPAAVENTATAAKEMTAELVKSVAMERATTAKLVTAYDNNLAIVPYDFPQYYRGEMVTVHGCLIIPANVDSKIVRRAMLKKCTYDHHSFRKIAKRYDKDLRAYVSDCPADFVKSIVLNCTTESGEYGYFKLVTPERIEVVQAKVRAAIVAEWETADPLAAAIARTSVAFWDEFDAAKNTAAAAAFADESKTA